jgi:hypothetical protein
MNLQILPAKTGLLWVRLGVRTFWRQPLALSGLFFLFMAAISLVSIVPVVGQPLSLALLPALTLGMMAATQTATEGRFPMPGTLFVALKAGGRRRAMLQLGGAYAAAFLVLIGISMLIDDGGFARIYLGGEPLSDKALQSDGFLGALWVSMLLYLPLSMMFWHAPALVFWHGVSPIKSLFFSWMACWRNLRAFAVYLIGWTLVFMAAGLLALALSTLIGDPQMMMPILMPLVLMVAAMFFTSMLFTVRDCFTALPHPIDPV